MKLFKQAIWLCLLGVNVINGEELVCSEKGKPAIFSIENQTDREIKVTWTSNTRFLSEILKGHKTSTFVCPSLKSLVVRDLSTTACSEFEENVSKLKKDKDIAKTDPLALPKAMVALEKCQTVSYKIKKPLKVNAAFEYVQMGLGKNGDIIKAGTVGPKEHVFMHLMQGGSLGSSIAVPGSTPAIPKDPETPLDSK